MDSEQEKRPLTTRTRRTNGVEPSGLRTKIDKLKLNRCVTVVHREI